MEATKSITIYDSYFGTIRLDEALAKIIRDIEKEAVGDGRTRAVKSAREYKRKLYHAINDISEAAYVYSGVLNKLSIRIDNGGY